ncbi:MAG: DUF4270 domain-containing protein [Flavobacteriales bacterium]|nr:DUF4270 domain-containing protein [Flavobacteriales bacterium]
MRITSFLIALLTISLIQSCTKEEDLVGDDLVDGSFFGSTSVDTLSIATSFDLVDSASTVNRKICILGAINDPVFGKTNSNLYTQLALSESKIDFGNATFDSLVLELPYLSHYGSQDAQQNFKVYRVSEKIDTTKKYSNENYLTSTELANISFKPQTTYQDGDQAKNNKLRIRLDNALGEEILKEKPDGALKDDASFYEFLKGIAIKSENNLSSGQGGLFQFDYKKIKMKLFFTESSNKKDSIDFVTSNGTNHLLEYQHDYQNSSIANKISKTNTPNLYIQGMAGIQTVLELPHFKNFADSLTNKTVINRALMEIHVKPDTNNGLVNHTELQFLLRENENETEIYTVPLDGQKVSYDSKKGIYSIPLTRTIQQWLQKGKAEKVYLRTHSVTSIRRTILEGVTSTEEEKRVKLIIMYSEQK